jgi:hypothetical protein
MRELAAVGIVALLFGLGAFYGDRDVPLFALANLAVAGACLLAAAALALRRSRAGGASPAARRLLVTRLAGVAVALVLAYACERGAARTGWVWDATADQRFTLAPATVEALRALPPGVRATLYHEQLDNRVRSVRLLLETLAEAGPLEVRARDLAEAAEEADHYGIGTSSSIVFELGDRYELVERPTEGSIYEALRLLATPHESVLYVTRGEGEGRLDASEDAGYSGLAAALQIEGYQLRDLVLPAADAIPADASLVLIVGPQRRFREPSLVALDAFLARGGRLVALLDPGVETGLEELLGRWGFGLPDALVVDPASGPVEGDPPGVNPIVFQFGDHPAARGLGPTRMVFLRRARPVLPERKPEPDDTMRAIAYSSRRAWLLPDPAALPAGAAPERPDDVEEDYVPLAAGGSYPRAAGEARIVAIGDADFASNRSLRALYNADFVLNAVHWAASRDPEITLRPKTLTADQFPLTPQQSLRMLYGVGLLVPELCLAAAALAWVRRRSG